MDTLTPVYVVREGDLLTVACNVHMARRITQELARVRDHVAGCPDCRVDTNPAQYAALIARFDDVFMHVDDDGDHEVVVYDPDRGGYMNDHVGYIPTYESERMFGSAMMEVMRTHEESRGTAYQWPAPPDAFRCHDITRDLYVYDRYDADYGTEVAA